MEVSFDLVEWCDSMETAACGVVNPALLPQERRRWERELAKLTTPEKCILAASRARAVVSELQKLENRDRDAFVREGCSPKNS